MANMNVSYDELTSACSSLERGRDNIFSELDSLKSRIGSLVQAGFVTDRSSVAFNDAFSRYSSGARQTIQGLDDVIAFLHKVEQTLRETDAQLAAAIG